MKNNFIAKNLNKFNRAATHVDQKKEMKRGKVKHQRDKYAG